MQRNSIFLPIYTVMLGLLAILGYMAIAAGIKPDHHYGANIAVPGAVRQGLPAAGSPASRSRRSRSARSVPAAMMAIAAANLFARNIYVELIRPSATSQAADAASRRSRRSS